MSILLNPNGSTRTYVVVDPQEETVLAGYTGIGAAVTGKKLLNHEHHVDRELVVHNITHTAIPAWLKDFVHADPAYCAQRAKDLQASGAGYRRKAAEAIAEADRLEGLAAEWQARADRAADPEPEVEVSAPRM